MKKTSALRNVAGRLPPATPAHFKPRREGPGVVASRPSRHPGEDSENDLPLDAEPRGIRPLPPPFAQVLEGVLQKLKLRVSPTAELLRAEWDELLPPAFKGRCLPGKIQRGFFYAFVPDSTALFELQRELPRLEAALAPRLAEMKARHVRLMIDPGAFQ